MDQSSQLTSPEEDQAGLSPENFDNLYPKSGNRRSFRKTRNLSCNSIASCHSIAVQMRKDFDDLHCQKVASLEQNSSDRIKYLEDELRLTKEKLIRSENILACGNQWMDSRELQLWLQLTYELETVHFTGKRQAAEAQLVSAKEGVSIDRKLSELDNNLFLVPKVKPKEIQLLGPL